MPSISSWPSAFPRIGKCLNRSLKQKPEWKPECNCLNKAPRTRIAWLQSPPHSSQRQEAIAPIYHSQHEAITDSTVEVPVARIARPPSCQITLKHRLGA